MYPGGPPQRPYDVTAQTLPMLMGVTVDTISQPFEASLSRASGFGEPARSTGVLPAGDVDSWRVVNQTWAAGKKVCRDSKGGDFHLERSRRGSAAEAAARSALYKSYVPSMDEGWTRWLLEQFGFAYANVENKELQAENLQLTVRRDIFPDQRAAAMESGYRPGSMPAEFIGGIGEKGAAQLKRFASQGGTLVFLNDATEYALEHLGLDAKNVLKGLSNKEFYSPGSLLNVVWITRIR